MRKLVLNRMAIEEVGANPERLAAAIHNQLKLTEGPIPIEAIARALDIVEIRVEALFNIEGALITPPERGTGSILINGGSGRRRQRFAIAHELGHFLNVWHSPTTPSGFACGSSDFRSMDLRTQDRHRRQEAEANTFAIELLAPRSRVKRHLPGSPDLQRVLALAEDLHISREAAVRRLYRAP